MLEWDGATKEEILLPQRGAVKKCRRVLGPGLQPAGNVLESL